MKAEFRILRPQVGAEPTTVWIAARATVVSSQMVEPRVVGIAYDISERKRAEELATLMAHEVEHRAKNALTVVSSLLRMTRATSAEELARSMEARISALSRTMGLLGAGRWKGTDLREILGKRA